MEYAGNKLLYKKKKGITPCPLVLTAMMCSFHLSFHTCPLHFSSI